MLRKIVPTILRLSRDGLFLLSICAVALPGLGATSKAAPLRLGVIAEEANEPGRMLRVYADFLSELRTRLAPTGIDVAPLVIASDLGDLARRLKRGEVDMVIESVFPTIELQGQSGRAIETRLVIFHETRPLLRGLLSIRYGLSGATRRACEDVLLAMPKDTAGKAALTQAAGITRFEPLTPKDLADLEAWRRALKGVPGK